MMQTRCHARIAASVLAFRVLGCNSILDNQPGTLVAADQSGALPNANSPSDASSPVTPDASTPPGCSLGQHLCNGACVSLNDPTYGCGDPGCAPCPSAHSSMGCSGRQCIVASCDPGYANCNAAPHDGCEVDLSKPETCGACNAACGVATPLCSAAGAGFQCTNGCTPAAPLKCGNTCVDPNTSTAHCGSCDVACPVIPGSIAQCRLGVCELTCKAGFHSCGNACPARTDPTACGPACVACPVPAGGAASCANDVCGVTCNAPSHACGARCVTNDPTACGAACTACVAPANATATCPAEACGFTCNAGFGNCDAKPANGCEATLATDPLNCGICGRSCAAGQSCVNNVCQAPPPAPPP